MSLRSRVVVGSLALALASQSAGAQGSPVTPLAVGTVAPDFHAVASTRAGVGSAINLSDYHGKTIVLAFFYRARTKG